MRQYCSAGTQLFSQFDNSQNPVALRGCKPLQLGRFNIRGMPAHIELARQPGSRAHGLLRARTRTNAYQQRTLGIPHRANRLFNPVAAHVVFHMLGSTAQGNFAQGNQVAFSEKVLCCSLGLLRQVDLAGL